MIVRTLLRAVEGVGAFTHKDANYLWEAVGSKLDIRTAVTIGTAFAAVAIFGIQLSTGQQIQPLKDKMVQHDKTLSSIQQDMQALRGSLKRMEAGSSQGNTSKASQAVNQYTKYRKLVLAGPVPVSLQASYVQRCFTGHDSVQCWALFAQLAADVHHKC